MKKQVLVLLAVMFFIPGLAAYVMYQYPKWNFFPTTNRGQLIEPAVSLPSLSELRKWRMIYWEPGVCAEQCLSQIDTLARIRLALGRKLYALDLWVLLHKNKEQASQKLVKTLRHLDIHLGQWSQQQLQPIINVTEKPCILLVNPDRYAILRYELGSNPNDIYKDLTVVLKSS